MSAGSREERAAGAILGVLIGDALGMGYQWYYDLSLKDRDVGEWVSGYIDPSPERADFFGYISKYRYEQGLRAGDTSQLGQVFALLLSCAATSQENIGAAFYSELDKLFESLSGESLSGRYTDGIYIKARQARRDGKEWGEHTATDETTSDGAVLVVVLAALHTEPLELARAAMALMAPLHGDTFIKQNAVVFGLAVQALINGVSFQELGGHIKGLAADVELRAIVGSFDTFLTPTYGAVALPGREPGGFGAPPPGAMVAIEPPKLCSLLFGLDCQLTHVLPAAYYLGHRYPDSFENAVLSAANGGGQNVARAAMTGALSGAAAGLSEIPARFVDGLCGGHRFVAQAREVAAAAT